MAKVKRDIYQTITDKMIALMEAGTNPWACSWDRGRNAEFSGLPRNAQRGTHYSGINVLLLWTAAQEAGFSTDAWVTYRQAELLGGHVAKGARSTEIIYYKMLEVADGDQGESSGDTDGDTDIRRIPWIKTYRVFNLDQLEGIDLGSDAVDDTQIFTPVDQAEHLLDTSGADIRIKGTRAYFSPSSDYIQLPDRHRFSKAEDFYATATHELTHWTGHADRLDRRSGKRFGDQAYAFEELVAELGSAFINASLGLQGVYDDHASYLDHWLSILKEDKRAIFKASTEASKAHRYLTTMASPEALQDAA